MPRALWKAARRFSKLRRCLRLPPIPPTHPHPHPHPQVVDLLIKLYKFPNFSISRALLHGTGATPGGSGRAGTPPTPAASAAGTAAREGPDVPIAGRCPGALADALLRLAEGVRLARLALVKDLRTRLLTLFAGELDWPRSSPLPFSSARVRCLACVHQLPVLPAGLPRRQPHMPPAQSATPPCALPADFALILPNDSYIEDLGALLPALGAVAEAVGAASSGRMSGGLQAGRGPLFCKINL